MAVRRNAQEREWRAQDALQTLTRADAIRSDKALMADVKKHATKQVATLSKVAGTSKSAGKPAPARKR